MSSGGGVNKVPLRWHGKVILMPAPYYCYNVTSEAGVWWVGVMPLGAMAGSQRSKKRSAYKHARVRLRGRTCCAPTRTHTHTQTLLSVCVCARPSLTLIRKPTPQGDITIIPLVANITATQVTEISRSNVSQIEMTEKVLRSSSAPAWMNHLACKRERHYCCFCVSIWR